MTASFPAKRVPAQGYLLVGGAAALWGTWPLWLRASHLGSALQTFVILTVLSLAGLPFALAHSRRAAARPRRAWGGIALLGLVNGGNNLLYFAALSHGAVALAVLTHYLAPVLVAALAWPLLREPLGRRTPVALSMALIGLTLLLAPWRATTAPAAAWLGAASAVCYALAILLGKRLARHFSSLEIACYHALTSAALVAPLALPGARGGDFSGLGWLLAAGLLLGLGASVAFWTGLGRIPAQHAGVLTYLEPLVAIGVGCLVFSERFSPLAALGGVLTVSGGLLVVASRDPTLA